MANEYFAIPAHVEEFVLFAYTTTAADAHSSDVSRHFLFCTFAVVYN